jgi:hypothetical protein
MPVLWHEEPTCAGYPRGMMGSRRQASFPPPAWRVTFPPKIFGGRSRGSSWRNGLNQGHCCSRLAHLCISMYWFCIIGYIAMLFH